MMEPWVIFIVGLFTDTPKGLVILEKLPNDDRR